MIAQLNRWLDRSSADVMLFFVLTLSLLLFGGSHGRLFSPYGLTVSCIGGLFLYKWTMVFLKDVGIKNTYPALILALSFVMAALLFLGVYNLAMWADMR